MTSSTDHNYRVLLGSFGSQFGAIQGKIDYIWRPNCSFWSHFGADFTPSSDPNWPESPKIMYSGTDHKHTVPGRSFRGHFLGNLGQFGPFGAHLEPNRKIWIIMGPMSPLLAAKKGFNFPLYQVQWNRLSTYSNSGGPKCAPGPFCVKQRWN